MSKSTRDDDEERCQKSRRCCGVDSYLSHVTILASLFYAPFWKMATFLGKSSTTFLRENHDEQY